MGEGRDIGVEERKTAKGPGWICSTLGSEQTNLEPLARWLSAWSWYRGP